MSTLKQLQGEGACKAWNAEWPPGTRVTLVNDDGELETTRTRSVAWTLGNGQPVVAVEGRSGGYSLERIVPLRVLGTEAKVLP